MPPPPYIQCNVHPPLILIFKQFVHLPLIFNVLPPPPYINFRRFVHHPLIFGIKEYVQFLRTLILTISMQFYLIFFLYSLSNNHFGLRVISFDLEIVFCSSLLLPYVKRLKIEYCIDIPTW